MSEPTIAIKPACVAIRASSSDCSCSLFMEAPSCTFWERPQPKPDWAILLFGVVYFGILPTNCLQAHKRERVTKSTISVDMKTARNLTVSFASGPGLDVNAVDRKMDAFYASKPTLTARNCYYPHVQGF